MADIPDREGGYFLTSDWTKEAVRLWDQIQRTFSIEDWGGETIMGLPISSIAPDLRKLDKSMLDKIHAAIHEKNIRNSDRLLIVSHLIDRYIEARTKIFMDVNEEVLGEITE